MPGGLLQTVVDARARRATLVAEAAQQRSHLGAYIDALDPASRWIDRIVSVANYLIDRPAIPAGVIAAIMVIKPRRIFKLAVVAWKAFSWLRRLKGKFGPAPG